MVGPFVTNPATRDPTVTASLFATLNDMFGNRTVCGIGRGDSARRVLGRRPTTLAQTERAIHVIRELAEGRAIETPAGAVSIPWVRDGRLDVWMAAYGPKALALAGRVADGFILQLADPVDRPLDDRPRARGRRPRPGATRPRSPSASPPRPTWATTWPTSATSAGGSAGWWATTSPRWSSATGPDGDIPHALTDYMRDAHDYDYAHHGRAGNPDTAFVPDAIVDHFCVLGTAEDHLEAARARGPRRRPVRHLPHARRQGRDARRLRRADHPGDGRRALRPAGARARGRRAVSPPRSRGGRPRRARRDRPAP